MTISHEHFQPGGIAKAADANAPYTEVQTESAAIGQDRTRTEWVTIAHMDFDGTSPITPYFGKVEDNSHTGTYNTLYPIWTTIQHPAGTLMRLSPGITLKEGDVLRIHGNALVKTVSRNTVDDLYWFRFFSNMNVDGGGATNHQLGFDWGYSLSSRDEAVGAGNHQVYGYQRVGFSWIHICKNTTEVINTIDLQFSIEDNTNSVDIGEVALYAFSSIH